LYGKKRKNPPPQKKKDSEAHGHDCLNCKHQPNICRFLSVLQAQILDIAFIAGVGKSKSKTFSIFSTTILLFVHPSISSPFHHSSSVIYSMFIDMKSCFNHFIPVVFIIIIHFIVAAFCIR
jgi:hypothetical protein